MKTYEDLEEVIKNAQSQGVRDFDEEIKQKEGIKQLQNPDATQSHPVAKATPPRYSTQEVYNVKQTPTQEPKIQEKQTPQKEQIEDKDNLIHSKSHTHGNPKGDSDSLKTTQIIQDFEKKKKTISNEQVKLRQVSIPTSTDNKDQMYFLLSTLLLILSCLAIVAGCFGALYLVYRIVFRNREKYFQFDEQNDQPNVIELTKITGLEEIKEVDEEQTNTNSNPLKDRKVSASTENSRSPIDTLGNNKEVPTFSNAFDKHTQ